MFKAHQTRMLLVILAVSSFLAATATARVLRTPQQNASAPISESEIITRLDVLEAMLADILVTLDNAKPEAAKDATGADLRNGVLYVKGADGKEYAFKCVGGEWQMVNDVWACVGGTVIEI